MNRYLICVASLVLALLGGCAAPTSERDMNYLGSALTKVSAAVDATVRYKRSADGLEDLQLLEAATAHDPALIKPFEGRTVRTVRVGRDSAVLLCEAGNGKALLEDAGCTAKLDVHRWNSGAATSCVFTLDLKQTCAW